MTLDASALLLTSLIAAPFVGSFLAVVALRLPRQESMVSGRSRCDICGQTLKARELIPLVSFAVLLGKCRLCAGRIDRLHPLLESAAIGVAAWAACVVTGWILIASCVLGWTLLLLAAIDWRTGLLPNILTLPLLVVGLAVTAAIDWASVIDHTIGAVVGFVAFAVVSEVYRRVRRRDGLGLGDAKLLAAAGAWLSWTALPSVVLLAACIALISVLIQRLQGREIHATDRITFGPALAGAMWLVWLYGPIVPGWL